MRKNILFVIDSLQCGGAEKSLVSLLPLLDTTKYKISLWLLNRGGVFESYLPNDIYLVQSPNYNIFERLLLKISSLLYSALIRINHLKGKKEHGAETLWKCKKSALKGLKEEFDIAIAYQQGLPTYLVSTKIKAKKKIAWVNCNIFNAGYSKTFNEPFYQLFSKINLVSKELYSIFSEEYPNYVSKLVYIYDILNPLFIKEQAKETVSDISVPNINQTIIVTAGRLAYQKNHQLAVETANILKNKGIIFKWYFVGEGSERKNIEDLISLYNLENNVILLGLKTNPYPYMNMCDIYVQTSRFEGFGLTIAEAKILGKPVVSTNFDVVHDQITHEKNGLISEMNAESLSNQIIRMIQDDKLRKKIIDNVCNEENTTYITEVKKVEELLDN